MGIINHGTVRGYKAGCRCDECTEANRKAKARERELRRQREGKTSRTPAAPRVPTKPTNGPIEEGPGAIEAAARSALSAAGGAEPVAVLRREVAYRAAAVMDNPKNAPFFKSAADVLRQMIADLTAAAPPKDGEADALEQLMGAFGPRRGSRGRAAVDDAAQSSAGDDR